MPGSGADADRWEHDLFERDRDRPRRHSTGMKPSSAVRSTPRDNVPAGAVRIMLENLHFMVTENDLKELFADFKIVQAKIKYDQTDRSEGLAALVFPTQADADAAMKKYDGMLLDNTPMQLRPFDATKDEWARPRPPRPDRNRDWDSERHRDRDRDRPNVRGRRDSDLPATRRDRDHDRTRGDESKVDKAALHKDDLRFLIEQKTGISTATLRREAARNRSSSPPTRRRSASPPLPTRRGFGTTTSEYSFAGVGASLSGAVPSTSLDAAAGAVDLEDGEFRPTPTSFAGAASRADGDWKADRARHHAVASGADTDRPSRADGDWKADRQRVARAGETSRRGGGGGAGRRGENTRRRDGRGGGASGREPADLDREMDEYMRQRRNGADAMEVD